MDVAWVASPGEWYRVLQYDANWALGVFESDPTNTAAWICLDERVELAPGDAPHSPRLEILIRQT